MATAREHSVFLMEALWTRFMPTVNKALALIENRAIGDPEKTRPRGRSMPP